ncbi:lactonase family protein [uncultured Bacteroides sp.]|uniref:lactonase family protein n=1 Tax=uncultured Bacteroides sp. TaxID=162156 RepID=UPI002AA7C33D|nr:lactonase family protein [uncultured Bacteroides sp.]
MIKKIISICLIGILVGCQSKKTAQENNKTANGELTMLVGTYTPAGADAGIYTFRLNTETGTVTPLSKAKASNPSYLTPSADGKFIYAVSEQADETAAVNAFAFDKEKGTLKKLNEQKTMGTDPCYVITNGKNVVTANYSGGSISVFPIQKDGSLLPASSVFTFEGSGPDSVRQKTPHLHCVRITPDGKYLFADDLGSDKIRKFNIDPQADATNKKPFLSIGTPSSFKLAAGSGPRHLTFAPNNRFAYLISELSGKVTAFEYADGQLKEFQSIAADTVGAHGSADIHISPDGKFLYASNRLKADGVAIFRINEANGMLTKVGYQLTGIHPRNFIITPNGKFLLVACRDSNVIQLFKRDSDTGLLTDTQKDIKLEKPVCIKFVE